MSDDGRSGRVGEPERRRARRRRAPLHGAAFPIRARPATARARSAHARRRHEGKLRNAACRRRRALRTIEPAYRTRGLAAHQPLRPARRARRRRAAGSRFSAARPGRRRVRSAPQHRRDERAGLIGRAIASEFRHRDAVSPLALQSLGLELVAAVARSSRARVAPRRGSRRPPSSSTTVSSRRFASRRSPTGWASGRASSCARSARSTESRSGRYARRLRLEWVARRLAESDEPIASLAIEAGFADQPHLTRAFRTFSGLTPARYRRSKAPSRGTS